MTYKKRVPPPLDILELAEYLLTYHPEQGVFERRVAMGRAKRGTLAGCSRASLRQFGVVQVEGHKIPVDRLAWWMIHGEWLELPATPLNGDYDDVRLSNLRPNY
jgi:hypothetical protein